MQGSAPKAFHLQPPIGRHSTYQHRQRQLRSFGGDGRCRIGAEARQHRSWEFGRPSVSHPVNDDPRRFNLPVSIGLDLDIRAKPILLQDNKDLVKGRKRPSNPPFTAKFACR